jgi:alanine racemase
MQSPDLRAWIDIDLGALLRNAAAVAAHSRARLLPMIKADAYGVGAIPAARVLETLDPWGYGVATIREGLELRASGITRPIIVFTPLAAESLADAHAAGITPSLSRSDHIVRWQREGGGPWHLAIDTGMSRAGVRWDEVATLRDLLAKFPPEGAYTHFHSAERFDESLDVQLERFRQAVDELPERPALLHTENSAAIVRSGVSTFDCVRPGIFLYGVATVESAELRPDPVVHFQARVVDMRRVRSGETVSYDATYRAVGDRTIATLGAGYADGYPRALSNRGAAAINGRRACVAGVVTMDMTMIDVTDAPCSLGDVATLIGAGDLDVATVSRTADMSPYELLTGLRNRIPRVYHEHGLAS